MCSDACSDDAVDSKTCSQRDEAIITVLITEQVYGTFRADIGGPPVFCRVEIVLGLVVIAHEFLNGGYETGGDMFRSEILDSHSQCRSRRAREPACTRCVTLRRRSVCLAHEHICS